MSFKVLPAADAFWRPSNQMGVLNTDLGKQLEATAFGARLWRLAPGQASTRHRHVEQTELYTVRQVFNDTEADALWLVFGTPVEAANTLEMTPEQLVRLYPDGPRALPPELAD